MRRLRVLLVEDSVPTRSALTRVLATRYEVLQAEDGAQALERIAAFAGIGVLVTDYEMPVLDGAGLIRALERAGHPLARRVVVITADPETAMGRVGLHDGVTFLGKPLAMAELFEAIDWTAARE